MSRSAVTKVPGSFVQNKGEALSAQYCLTCTEQICYSLTEAPFLELMVTTKQDCYGKDNRYLSGDDAHSRHSRVGNHAGLTRARRNGACDASIHQ